MRNDTEDSGHEVAIIYEDKDIIAVNKPAGLVVHADGRTAEPTLTDWVLAKYPDIKDVGGMHTLDSERYVPRAGILHRLDRETSGVIVIAKDDVAFYSIQRQFLDRSITKTYHAFVWGVPDPRQGTIDLPIGRSRTDFRQWTTGSDARGTERKAITEFIVLSDDRDHAYLELRPRTGRTHQLRVHMKAIGHPIVCDTRYGSATALGFERLALHATTLVFTLPSGKEITLSAPLPNDFLAAISLVEQRAAL
jgi:23S rRNA pseudouridine1911/1915/1917 synthase